jgi:mRNA-degrading endonuclease RelE of RelBE toxin-antitoxin system
MSYKIIPTPPFEKELKQLVKKHPSLRNEMRELVLLLAEQPQTGTSLGKN